MEMFAASHEFVKQKLASIVATPDDALKAALAVGGAVGAAFVLWPVAAAVAGAAGAMNAPGAAGFVICRAAFVANPQLYFQILRTAGPAAAAAAFAPGAAAAAVFPPFAAVATVAAAVFAPVAAAFVP